MTIDVLADRYASEEMRWVWSPQRRTALCHQIWIDVMEAQRRRGVEISEEQMDAYRQAASDYENALVDVDAWDWEVVEAERRTRHDLKAQLEVFDRHAGGHGKAHLGMTSCDITETVTERQVIDSLELVRTRIAAALQRLDGFAQEYAVTTVVARTHHQPAQYTTLGVRFARCAEELVIAYAKVADLAMMHPRRGIRGAVGNHVDMAAVLDGDYTRALALSADPELGLELEMVAVGQTPSRITDVDVVGVLLQTASGPGSLAVTLRLMAGAGQAYERATAGQVGSSAMPHKRNPRYLERIQGFLHILRGYQTMISSMAGVTWYEGDVTDSVTRRIALPGMFYATDGLLQTFCYALDRLAFDLPEIGVEVERYGDRTATGRLLAAEVSLGTPREQAHEVLRELSTAEAMTSGSSLAERIGEDSRLKLTAQMAFYLTNRVDTGSAPDQVETMSALVKRVVDKHPEIVGWQPAVNN